MKKIIILLALCLLAMYVSAQTGLTTTSSIIITPGIVKPSLYVEMKPRMSNYKQTGTIVYDLFFYNSYAAKQAGYSRVYPLINGNSLFAITVAITDADVINASGITRISSVEAFHYQKIKDALLAQYSITCN